MQQVFRHKLFTIINISGLALSMCVGMVIIAMILNLLNFDHFHARKERIYRVTSKVFDPNRSVDDKATAPIQLAEKLKSYSQVEQTVRIRKSLIDVVMIDNSEVNLNGYFTEPSFSEVFSFPFLRGDPRTALIDPYSIMITQQTALKIFNTEDVLGKTMTLKRLGTFQITGLLADIPQHSHMQFDALASFSTVPILEKMVVHQEGSTALYPITEYWDRIYTSYVYVLLSPETRPDDLVRPLDNIANEVYPDKNSFHASFSLQPVLAIVPGSGLSSEIGPKMIYPVLILMSGLAFVILIAACFNYTNLSIARALQRTREVGVRKISGANRSQIIGQFLLESICTAFLSLVIGMCLFSLITPHVLENIPRAAELFDFQFTPPMILMFIAFALLTGAMAGILPALALSRVNIVEALRQVKNIKLVGKIGIRNALVIFQFMLSLFLFTAMAILYQQYQYALHKDLGFTTDNLLIVDLNGADPPVFSHVIQNHPDVASVTFSSAVPGTGSSDFSLITLPGSQDSFYVNCISTESRYIHELDFQFLAGGNFPDSAGGKNLIIINEQFLPILNATVPADALNEWIVVNGEEKQIVGVVNDFHYGPLEDPIQAFFFKYDPVEFRYINIRLNSSDRHQTMSALERNWKSVNPGRPFVASFFDDRIEETYQFFVRLMRVFGFIGLLSMVIAILGLLGMTSYNTERRTKEIGIRKALGAKVWQVVLLLSRQFVGLLVIAAVIALPAAYLLFDRVILNLNAYRISIGPIEMVAGFLLLLLLGGTVIFSQTIKAAMANPVKSLRSE